MVTTVLFGIVVSTQWLRIVSAVGCVSGAAECCWLSPCTGGGGIAVGGGGSKPIAKNCGEIAGKLLKIAGKLRKIAGKLRHCKQPSVTLKVQQFWTGGSDFSFQSYKTSMGSTITRGALNITMELKHEPKAADVVIQFVLPLRNRPTL